MAKRSRLSWLIIGGIILLGILIASLFLFSPSPQMITIPSPAIISSTDFVVPQLLNPLPILSQSTARKSPQHRSISRSLPIPALKEILLDSWAQSTVRRKGFLMPAPMQAELILARPAQIRLRSSRIS